MDYQQLVSSMLTGCQYDETTGALTIDFQTGGSKTYYSVPEDVAQGLVGSPSPGSYYHRQIKNRYVGR